MLSPLFLERDEIEIGRDYLRNLNTGTLNIGDLTPRLVLLRRRDGAIVGEVKSGKVDDHNLLLAVRCPVTNLLDMKLSYQLNIGFDNPKSGDRIPFGVIALTPTLGAPTEAPS